MKIALWIVGILIFLFAILQIFMWWQDEYIAIEEVVSPDGERVAVLIGNHGGGGPGYCRDLVYNFPNSDKLPPIKSNWAEYINEEYLVKVVFCGDIEELAWNNKELTWKNKGSIPDY